MKGVVVISVQSGEYVAIQTEDGDFAIARVMGAELELYDLVIGDLTSPGRTLLRRAATVPVEVFVVGCRMQEKAVRNYLTSVQAGSNAGTG